VRLYRTLNPKKLVEVGFCRQPTNMTLAAYIKSLKLPTATQHPFLTVTKADIPSITVLLNSYLLRYEHIVQHYIHMCLP
jgi:hypothetical protein